MIYVSFAACGGEYKREFYGDPLLHLPDARPHTHAEDCVLCTPIWDYYQDGFLSV